MQSTRFRVVTGLIILALLAALAAAVIWTAQNTPSVVALPTPAPSPTPSPTPTATSAPQAMPDTEIQVDSGGFAFQPPAGYTVNLAGADVVLTSRGAQRAEAITVTLRSGAPAMFGFAARNLEDAAAALLAQVEKETGLRPQGEAVQMKVGSADALRMTFEEPGGAPAGLLVVAAPTADRFFVLEGRGALTPPVLAELGELLAGIRFFAPSVAANPGVAATPAPTATVRAVQTPVVAATPRPAVAGATVTTTTGMASLQHSPGRCRDGRNLCRQPYPRLAQ
ncbi:MAG: hypothetical protein IPK16_04285 [Anaerolineales bacterium]|nr:hypothetical protein [Anaerolineales bacterium]